MRIECPSCGAAYEVPDSVLIPGRLLRCAQCARDWMPGGHAADPVAPPVAGFVESASEPPAVAPLAPRAASLPAAAAGVGKVAILAAWAASILVLATLGWSAVTWRTAVMHAWPPSTRLYAALRLG